MNIPKVRQQVSFVNNGIGYEVIRHLTGLNWRLKRTFKNGKLDTDDLSEKQINVLLLRADGQPKSGRAANKAAKSATPPKDGISSAFVLGHHGGKASANQQSNHHQVPPKARILVTA